VPREGRLVGFRVEFDRGAALSGWGVVGGRGRVVSGLGGLDRGHGAGDRGVVWVGMCLGVVIL
jgi:hypothetical protein